MLAYILRLLVNLYIYNMDESGNSQVYKAIEQEAIPRYRTSIITNTLIIILFFFTFCQIKGCKGNYTPVSGFQLSLGALTSLVDFSPAFLFIGGVLIALVASILGLVFCFSNPQKMEKRAVICGITGCIGMAAFIILCLLEKGIILEWPPFVVFILNLVNAIYYSRKPIKIESNTS